MFASEIKAILEHPAVPRAVDREALVSYLALQLRARSAHDVRGDCQAFPGHVLIADETGVVVERYWAPVFADVPRRLDDGVVAEERERLLQESISLRLVADVPLGALLSGGVDSSLIVALMARASPGRIKTFTVGFEEAELQRADRSATVAELLGTDHHEEILKPGQVEASSLVSSGTCDEPIADQAAIPTYLICGAAAATVRVVPSAARGATRSSAGTPATRVPDGHPPSTIACPRSRPGSPLACRC